MGNCLVSKLKSPVNNDSLLYFNGVRFTGTQNQIVSINANKIVSLNNPFDVYANNGTTVLATSVKEYINPNDGTKKIKVLTDNTKFVAFDKSDHLSRIDFSNAGSLGEFNIGDFNYANKLMYTATYANKTDVVGKLDFGTIEDVSGTAYVSLQITDTEKCEFVIPQDVLFGVGLTYFYICETNGNNQAKVSCSIMSFQNCTAITTIFLKLGNNVSGEIVELCSALHRNGKDSGQIAFGLGGTNCTLNGNAIATGTNIYAKFGSSMVSPTEEEIAQGYQIV